jgi:hypothetical protein
VIAGVMGALAVAAVLSLLLTALRVHRRGQVGPVASAALRSLWPLVLGLGGWCLGTLVVLTTMPTVPLDDEILAALSIGTPIGCEIYLAWTNAGRSRRTTLIGFAASTAAALVGAWLGFHATQGLAALLTSIIGAAVGANLILVALDIAWERQAQSTPQDPSSVAELQPIP